MHCRIGIKALIATGLIGPAFLLFSAGNPAHRDRAFAYTDSTFVETIEPKCPGIIPPRPPDAVSGSCFARMIATLPDSERQKMALIQLARGNVPDFMRQLYPLRISVNETNGKMICGTLWVSPDYISIGSDSDFVRFPLAYFPAVGIARAFGCVLPTPKMVDAIYRCANVRLLPQPLPAGPRMRSCDYCLRHQRIIEEQRGTRPVNGIIAGHKKDVVLSNRLWKNDGRIAIYGWHKTDRSPIQPLSTVHGRNYADYSHGIRLVWDSVCVEGKMRSVYDVLEDPAVAPLLSYEGPIRNPEKLMRPARQRIVLSMNSRSDRFAASEP